MSGTRSAVEGLVQGDFHGSKLHREVDGLAHQPPALAPIAFPQGDRRQSAALRILGDVGYAPELRQRRVESTLLFGGETITGDEAGGAMFTARLRPDAANAVDCQRPSADAIVMAF